MGTDNLFQDPPEEIADDIIKILQIFQSNYNSINIAIGDILPCDASCSINWVLIKEVKEILKDVPDHSLYISATIVLGLLQIVHLRQTSSLWIICIQLKSEI